MHGPPPHTSTRRQLATTIALYTPSVGRLSIRLCYTPWGNTVGTGADMASATRSAGPGGVHDQGPDPGTQTDATGSLSPVVPRQFERR